MSFPFYPCLQNLKNKNSTENLEVTSTREWFKYSRNLHINFLILHLSENKKKKRRNQLEIHTRFATSKMSPSHWTIHKSNTEPLGRQDSFKVSFKSSCYRKKMRLQKKFHTGELWWYHFSCNARTDSTDSSLELL